MAKNHPYCLTIAGFDPSGGAGVIADCKTFEQFQVQGLSVITCNTIQTEDSFYSYNWIDLATSIQQLTMLLDRYPIQFVKIGLVENASALIAIVDLLHQKIKHPIIIWDPILQPTFGQNTIDGKRFNESLETILSKVSFITPNKMEFESFFGQTNPQQICSTFKLKIYLKGGHSTEKGKDFLYTEKDIYPINPKVKTNLEKHGTGCIFSSALTACLSKKYPLIKSCLQAKKYVENRIISNKTLLAYHAMN